MRQKEKTNKRTDIDLQTIDNKHGEVEKKMVTLDSGKTDYNCYSGSGSQLYGNKGVTIWVHGPLTSTWRQEAASGRVILLVLSLSALKPLRPFVTLHIRYIQQLPL